MRIIFFFLSLSLPLSSIFPLVLPPALKFVWFVCENRRSCLAFKRDFFIILFLLLIPFFARFFRRYESGYLSYRYIYPAIDWPANWHLKLPRVESQNLLFVFAPVFYWQTFLLLRIIFIRFALFINEMNTHWRIWFVNVEHDIKFNCIIDNRFNLWYRFKFCEKERWILCGVERRIKVWFQMMKGRSSICTVFVLISYAAKYSIFKRSLFNCESCGINWRVL